MFDIEFKNVSKRYTRRTVEAPLESPVSLWDRLFRRRGHQNDFWALRDISFHVERGEALGIIGHNGAGKSTILKLLSRITAPTAGEISIRGRLSSLIEVSSGFHAELTGRENVYLSGVTFGMSRKEVSARLPSILEFSGIGDFIDVPVKRYSTGMYLRLGFSIAAHLNPDILLLDEVLAVGDVPFQWKCLDHIQQLRKEGRTIVLISHDLAAVERLCDRALLLSHGRIVCEGRPQNVTLEYQRSTLLASEPPEHAKGVSRKIECTRFSYWNANRADGDPVRPGEAMIVRVDYVAHETVPDVVFNVYLYWPSGYLCTQLTTGDRGALVAKGSGCVEFFCPIVNLRPGMFLVDVAAERYPEVIDWRHRCAALRVEEGPVVPGDLHMPHEHSILTSHGESCSVGR
ncbi:MAG: ABC transporter ATP-binding protein [Acidobacteriia bacterium]|nr:ABC transporter ATP-binding protein [Terriglobia bacterium]